MTTAKKYYNAIAGGYDVLYREEQLKKWEAAKRLIEFSGKDLVLDVGCGTGFITAEIAKLVKEVVAIDISDKMIDNAICAKNIKYLVASAEKLPFKDKSFDKVISFTVLQDIENKDDALKEMGRVCKNTLLITVQKRGKNFLDIQNLISKYFKIKDYAEEEKDFIFLLESS